MPKFEQVSAINSNPQKRIEGMKQLISSMPEANRTLLTWIFVHMGHVIERERFNKMTIQNVSIVLSPTMKISHRVLYCFFENSHILFEANNFKKYVPPIIGGGSGKFIFLIFFKSNNLIAPLLENAPNYLGSWVHYISKRKINSRLTVCMMMIFFHPDLSN